jgi:hypothetical protein
MTEAVGAFIGLALVAGFVAFIVWRRKVSKTAKAKEEYGVGGGGGRGDGGTTHTNQV